MNDYNADDFFLNIHQYVFSLEKYAYHPLLKFCFENNNGFPYLDGCLKQWINRAKLWLEPGRSMYLSYYRLFALYGTFFTNSLRSYLFPASGQLRSIGRANKLTDLYTLDQMLEFDLPPSPELICFSLTRCTESCSLIEDLHLKGYRKKDICVVVSDSCYNCEHTSSKILETVSLL
jgi:hypothetical protein